MILRKIIRIVATRCQIFTAKCRKFDFGWGTDTAKIGPTSGLEHSKLFWLIHLYNRRMDRRDKR